LAHTSIFDVEVMAPEQMELAQALQAEAQTAATTRRRAAKSAGGGTGKGNTAPQPHRGMRRKELEMHTTGSAETTGGTDKSHGDAPASENPVTLPTLFPPDPQ
ncbi:MAG: hypothetical protein ABI068_13925, partial [Ktedonobacterales bacterium]